MKYMGSKRKHVISIINNIQIHNIKGKIWREPFVGGGNIIERIKWCDYRIGSDINENVINALKIIRDSPHKLPKNNKEFTEEDYNKLKTTESWLKPFAGFAYSFGAKWMGGFCRGENINGIPRDYVEEAYNAAIRQSKLIKNVELIHSDYKDLKIKTNEIIYCDPPYRDTCGYDKINFNHVEFWDWCLWVSKKGNMIFISEYQAPDAFVSIVEKQNVCSSLDKNTGNKKAIEKLYIPKQFEFKRKGLGLKL